VKQIIVDTNVFLRFLLNDIPKQKIEFEKLIKRAKENKIELLVPQIIIFEINFILEKYYGYGKKEIIDRLKSLVSASYFQVESRETFLAALSIYGSTSTSFVDCFLISQAKDKNAEIFTFDKVLKKLSG